MNTQKRLATLRLLVGLCLTPLLVSVGCSTQVEEAPTCVGMDQGSYGVPHLELIWAGGITSEAPFAEHPVSDAGPCGHTAGEFNTVVFSIPKRGTYVATAARSAVDSVLSIRRTATDRSCEEVLACHEIRAATASGMGGAADDDDSGECLPADVGLGGAPAEVADWCFPPDIQVRAVLEKGDEVLVTLAAEHADEYDITGAIYFYEEE